MDMAHLSQMKDHSHKKFLCVATLPLVQRSFKEEIERLPKKSLITCCIDEETLSDLATDCSAWNATISEAMTNFEENRASPS